MLYDGAVKFLREAIGALEKAEEVFVYEPSVDYIKSRIERMEERLVNKEKLLREQFVRLENLLAKLNVQSQYVTNQLSKIPTIGYTK